MTGGRCRDGDLHTVCIRSASLLHTRKLRCWGQGPGPAGGICGMVHLRHAGAFLLRRAFTRTLSVTSNSVRGRGQLMPEPIELFRLAAVRPATLPSGEHPTIPLRAI